MLFICIKSYFVQNQISKTKAIKVIKNKFSSLCRSLSCLIFHLFHLAIANTLYSKKLFFSRILISPIFSNCLPVSYTLDNNFRNFQIVSVHINKRYKNDPFTPVFFNYSFLYNYELYLSSTLLYVVLQEASYNKKIGQPNLK